MKLKKIVLSLFLIVSIIAAYYLSLEPLYTPTAITTPNEKFLLPKYIAHKSIISGNYPGNSKKAILEALNSPVEGIEVDVRLSKDQVPFIYHAETLGETNLGSGRPEDKNWSELKSALLSLEEIFEIVGSEKYLFLDIKEKGVWNNNFATKIADLIEKYEIHNTVIVESLNPAFLAHMRLRARDIMIMYDFVTDAKASEEEIQSQFDAIPWILKQPWFQKQFRRILRPDILGPRWNISGLYMQELIANGYPLIAWTVDNAIAASKLFSLGVIGIQSNYPQKIMQELNVEAPQKVTDAGGTESFVESIIYVTEVEDVLTEIQNAHKNNQKISIAGRKHSMGGQSLLSGSIHLNMLGFNKVYYNPETKRVTAEAGATWKKIQQVLDAEQRSVIIMQSDTIFTVGGSVSVNVHGWQVGMPPLGSTIHSLKVATADGKIETVSLNNNPELFKCLIGGYGQFGIILEIELETAPNDMLKFHNEIFPSNQFVSKFENYVSSNPKVELAYGRLSVDKDNLLTEAMLNWYEKLEEGNPKKIEPERFIAIKRAIFRSSEYSDLGKKIRWGAEKTFSQQTANLSISRNTAMNPDSHVLWPIREGYRDILQEYFVPKENLNLIIEKLQIYLKRHPVNLLNVTIREVRKDNISALPYAKTDMFALVLLFSQSDDAVGETNMIQFTTSFINEVLALNGCFYLPYRLHYTKEQLITAYPNIKSWVALKKRFDPESIFSSQFMNYLAY